MARQIIIGCLLLFPSALWAHPLDLGFAELSFEGRAVRAVLELNADLPPILMPSVDPQNVDGKLAAQFFLEMPLTVDGDVCPWDEFGAVVSGKNVQLTAEATCPGPARNVEWYFGFLRRPNLPRTFKLLVKARRGEGELLSTLDAQTPKLRWLRNNEVGFGDFIRMGMEHIGAAPTEWRGSGGFRLPDGIDHILFLCALILAGSGLWGTVKTVTGFTVGHSISLALATFGWLRFPSRWVESAIALSIAYVAARALWVWTRGRETEGHGGRVAAVFGLVHGFGFATAISSLALSRTQLVKALVGFNLGVELGQLILLLPMAGILVLATRSGLPRRFWATPALTVIFLVGTFWFMQRAFGWHPGPFLATIVP